MARHDALPDNLPPRGLSREGRKTQTRRLAKFVARENVDAYLAAAAKPEDA